MLLLVFFPGFAADPTDNTWYWNTEKRNSAVDKLVLLGRTHIKKMASSLKDKDPLTRNTAALALCRLDPIFAKKKALPVVRKDLKRRNVSTRRAAVLTLGEMGAVAAQSVPDLIALMEKARIWPKKKKSLPHKIAYQFLRAEIAEALGKFGPASKRAVPLLIEELKADPLEDKEYGRSDVHIFARDALVRIGSGATVPLIRAARDDDPVFQERIVHVLGEIGPTAKTARIPLKHLLMRDDVLLDPAKRSLCDAIIESLGRIDSSFQKETLLTMHAKEARHAAETFANFILGLELERGSDKLTEDYVASYVRALENSNPLIRKKAAQALAKIGPKAGEATLSLSWTVFDEDAGVAVESAKALGAIGTAANEAAPYLIEALNSPFVNVRIETAGVLAKIGALEPKEILQIFWAAKDKDSRVRKTLKESLTRIGMVQPAAFQEAVAILREK